MENMTIIMTHFENDYYNVDYRKKYNEYENDVRVQIKWRFERCLYQYGIKYQWVYKSCSKLKLELCGGISCLELLIVISEKTIMEN